MNAELAAELKYKLEENVEVDGNLCFLWLGSRTKGGYANLGVEGVTTYAHRLSYELNVGSIPEGLVLDHLCRVRHCINHAHLEPVTNQVNTVRGRVATVNRQRAAA
jgi:hypothetical protein